VPRLLTASIPQLPKGEHQVQVCDLDQLGFSLCPCLSETTQNPGSRLLHDRAGTEYSIHEHMFVVCCINGPKAERLSQSCMVMNSLKRPMRSRAAFGFGVGVECQ
jgi:hypothetical protein